MHQSPQKLWLGRRDKHVSLEFLDGDAQAERLQHRSTQPKTRKFQPERDEGPRAARASSGGKPSRR